MRGRASGKAIRVVWAIAMLWMAIGIVAPASAAPEQIEKVGRLDFDPPPDASEGQLASGSLVLNPEQRRGYQMFRLNSGKTHVRIINLDTLKVEGNVIVPVLPSDPGTRPESGEYLTTVDRENDRLFFSYIGTTAGGLSTTWGGVAMVDAKTMTYKLFSREAAVDPARPVNDPNCTDVTTAACQPQFNGFTPANLWSLEFADSYLTGLSPKLLLMYQESTFVPTLENNLSVVWLFQWDAETGRQDWMYRVTACQQAQLPRHPQSRYSVSILQGGAGVIYVGCSAGGQTGQAVRLTVDSLNKPTGVEESFVGPSNVADVFADPEDDRLLFLVVNEEGNSVWVFNGRASSYSGVVGVTLEPASIAMGVDRSSGRMYVMSGETANTRQTNPGGLLISDIRRNPAPQGVQFTEFSQPGSSRILVDHLHPEGRRIFFRPVLTDVDHYVIYQDNVPISDDPPLTDLDRFTIDQDEKSGVTDRNFTATGHAYGLRYIFVGGLEGYPPTGPDISAIRLGRAVPAMVGSPCGTGDRTLAIGHTKQAQFSNNIMNAAATPGEADPGTGTDVAQPTERCYPHPRPPLAENWYNLFAPTFGEEYPRPLDTNSDIDDDVEQARDENQKSSDLDEAAGNAWPFLGAECSEGSDSRSTKMRPADRDVDSLEPYGYEPENEFGDKDPKKDTDYERARKTELQFEGINASARCDNKGGSVQAAAQLRFREEKLPAFSQEGVPEIGTISVGEVSSRTHLFLSKTRGLVARTEAVVRGIKIGSKIYIDKAITIGEAWANGRFGGSATSFFRRLCGVRLPESGVHYSVVDLDVDPIVVDQGVGDVYVGEVDPLDEDTDDINQEWDVEGCGDSPVALPQNVPVAKQPALDAINRALGARGRLRTPDPDPELRQGTPGGYLASIQKDRLEQVGSRSVNNDESTQVPALELIIYNDDPTKGRGRQIYQFAGVDASVTYGIYLLNPPFDDPIDLPDELIDITEPPFVPPVTELPPPSGGPPPTRPRGPVTMLFSGISFLFRSPLDMMLAGAVWALLYSPVQLALRRRALKGVG